MSNILTSTRGVLRKGRTLSIMPTFQCNAACENCGTYSNPDVKIHLDSNAISKAINEANKLGFLNVVFTGGEPTLRWRILIDAIKLASSLGMLTRVVTNAFWAKSEELAFKKLTELKNHGLNEINFSTGDQHILFVELDRVAYAMLAANKLGIMFHVNVEGSIANRIKKMIC